MNTMVKLGLPALFVAAVFPFSVSSAQQAPAQSSVVGTWALVSETAHQGDKTTQPLGPHPIGSIMLDRGRRFMLLIARPDLPIFAANKRDAGTPEENKEVLAGLLAFIGTYTVNEAEHVLILHLQPARSRTGSGPTRSVF